MYNIGIEIWEGKSSELKIDDEGIINPNVVREGIGARMYRGMGRRATSRENDSITLKIGEKSVPGWLLILILSSMPFVSAEPIASS